ncbi:hypothetical protein [uncultured Aquimarina sp.]|uniref:hypothetical protein n=1 Tax=uncultured Aquimarina sp. TaxID=575652 RepID=UPI00262D0E8B|nr:hypothetical protein [uncultured Aquimarina sp.]
MKVRFFSFLLLIGLLFNSCNNNDCELVVCAPNASFRFQIVNSEGENVISSSTLLISDIMILDVNNQNTVDFTVINENNTTIVVINSTSISTGKTAYSIEVSNSELFALELTTERIDGECCDVINFIDLEIQNSEYVFDQNTDVYTFSL